MDRQAMLKEIRRVIDQGPFTDGADKGFTPEDIRFTAKGGSLYAIVMKRPRDGQVCVRSLGVADASIKPRFHGIIREVALLGEQTPPAWERKEDGLFVRLGPGESGLPAVIKITLE